MYGQPVTYSYVIKELHKTVTFKGLDPTLYICHSFHIGVASIVANFKKGGRWNLNAIKRYIRLDGFRIPYSNSVNAGNFDNLPPALHTIV